MGCIWLSWIWIQTIKDFFFTLFCNVLDYVQYGIETCWLILMLMMVMTTMTTTNTIYKILQQKQPQPRQRDWLQFIFGVVLLCTLFFLSHIFHVLLYLSHWWDLRTYKKLGHLSCSQNNSVFFSVLFSYCSLETYGFNTGSRFWVTKSIKQKY